jgi:hypothetical protein
VITGKEFEIIDMDFSADMPWLALPQNAFDAKNKLGEAFRVETCPMLVIIDPGKCVYVYLCVRVCVCIFAKEHVSSCAKQTGRQCLGNALARM